MRRIVLLFRSFPLLLAARFSIVYAFKQLFIRDASLNYSLTGEDAIIRSLLDENRPAFYVDVGCNDPVRWSNTLSLYMHGWRGINIDANAQLIERFRNVRRRDICVCAAISDVEQDIVFHEFENDLVSTVSVDVLPEWQRKWKKKAERRVRARRLDSILEQSLPPDVEIGLLSIDVEGHDLNVLQSIDLNRFRPKLIVVEIHDYEFNASDKPPITTHLESNGYSQVGYDSLNGYFLDARNQEVGARIRTLAEAAGTVAGDPQQLGACASG